MTCFGHLFIFAAAAALVQGITPDKFLSRICPPGTITSGPCFYGRCSPGSMCYRSYLGSQCCRTSQLAIQTCAYGDRGACNVFYPYTCPAGTRCTREATYSPYNIGAGRCCNSRFAEQQTCPFGETGTSCGGLLGQQCPFGSTCIYPPDYIADAPGKCCLNTSPIAGTCPTGPTGHTCGGFVGAQCPAGSYCRYRPGGGSLGDCCLSIATTPVERPGICPANNVIGICAITTNSCTSDSVCPLGLKCCSRGCGRECVYPLYYTIG